MDKRFRITLLFNANKVYDREVIEGIGEYLQASQCDWDIFLEEEFTTHLDNFHNWKGDGVIADFDNPKIAELLKDSDIPVVGVGGSYEKDEDYPDIPYVATDNQALVELAYQHLREKGLENFAFYGKPHDKCNRWAHEREKAFSNIVKKEGYTGSIYRGSETNSRTWTYDMNRLADWLQRYPPQQELLPLLTHERVTYYRYVSTSTSWCQTKFPLLASTTRNLHDTSREYH